MRSRLQQQIELTESTMEFVRNETGQKWRSCQRKAYCVSVIQIPPEYIFANKLEQPDSYNYLFKTYFQLFGFFVPKAKLSAREMEFLNANGHYETKPDRFVICGTVGEMWDVTFEKLQKSYTFTDGSPITDKNSLPNLKWFQVKREQESSPSAVGIVLPTKYLGLYKTSWALLTVNNPASEGHFYGDVLVVPVDANGNKDFAHVSPTNNSVFAATFDQSVGGWAQSKLIMSQSQIRQPEIAKLNAMLRFPNMSAAGKPSANPEAKNWMQAYKSFEKQHTDYTNNKSVSR